MLIAEFKIHDLPKMINRTSGKHWINKFKESVKWRGLVGAECYKAEINDLKLDSAVLTLTRHSSKAPDSDGLVSGFKVVIDALVKHGVLIDDNYKIIGMPKYIWEYAPKKQGAFVTVKIETEVEDGPSKGTG